jgi:hypothetical protein
MELKEGGVRTALFNYGRSARPNEHFQLARAVVETLEGLPEHASRVR